MSDQDFFESIRVLDELLLLEIGRQKLEELKKHSDNKCAKVGENGI